MKAVDGVSLAVRRGTTLGVVGESGSGKTTLGLALLRLTEAQGHIRFAERDIATLGQRQLRPLRREMQVVFQDPFSSRRRGSRSRRSSRRGSRCTASRPAPPSAGG